MLIDRSGLHVYDLAEEWRKQTDLPFVFAFWAVREGSKAWPGSVDFTAAKREGIAHIEQIADSYTETLGLSHDSIISYLTRNISYDLDDESLEGLRTYYELAKECGLIERVRDLEFG
jgi:chorismate dehydratase